MLAVREEHHLGPGTHNHHRRRHVRLAVVDRAGFLQQIHQCGIVWRRLADQRSKADGTVPTDDMEVVFEGNGQAVQRAHQLPRGVEMAVQRLCMGNGFGKEDFRQAVYLELWKTDRKSVV